MTTKAIQRTMARPSDMAADLRWPALNVAGSKASRAGQMSAAIELMKYAYSDTKGPAATAPTAAVSQSGNLRRTRRLTNGGAKPVSHQGTMASDRTYPLAPAAPMMAAYGP